jgi:hypothetical protein
LVDTSEGDVIPRVYDPRVSDSRDGKVKDFTPRDSQAFGLTPLPPYGGGTYAAFLWSGNTKPKAGVILSVG